MVFMANGGAVAEVAATAEIQIQHAALHTILHANPCACAVYSSALLHLLNFSCYSGCSTASSTTGSPSTALAALHHYRNPHGALAPASAHSRPRSLPVREDFNGQACAREFLSQ